MGESIEKTEPKMGWKNWLFHLDRILRGEATQPKDIQQADIKIPVVGISVVVIGLAMIYGFCMGIFALVRGVENSEYAQSLMQTFASMSKVPLLFFLTLVVTFPSLYVFNALVGSKLRIGPTLKLLIASLAVNLAVLASMGPILAFFSVSTPNYHFIVLLNVVVFAIAGVLGLAFLIQTLNRLSLAEGSSLAPDVPARQHAIADQASEHVDPIAPVTELSEESKDLELAEESEETTLQTDVVLGPSEIEVPRSTVPHHLTSKEPWDRHESNSTSIRPRQTGPLDRLEGIVLGRHVRKVFICWIVLFGLVGAQMGWVLRPFIGSPTTSFSWFRARNSNFFEAVFNTLVELLFGEIDTMRASLVTWVGSLGEFWF